MLMHLHVALRPAVLFDTLIFHITDAEQGKLAQGIATAQAAPEEVVGVAEQKALVSAAGQGSGDFTLHGRSEDLIGVEKKHPPGVGRVGEQEPVALFGEVAIPVEGDQLSAVRAGNICCGIGAGRIDHHHLAGEISADGLQA